MLLMDAHVVVGVGNIYANESLFRSGIRPRSRRVASVGIVVSCSLRRSGRADAGDPRRGAQRCGISSTDPGRSGYFSQSLNVYGREDQPCYQCGAFSRGYGSGNGRPSTVRSANNDAKKPLAWCYSSASQGDSRRFAMLNFIKSRALTVLVVAAIGATVCLHSRTRRNIRTTVRWQETCWLRGRSDWSGRLQGVGDFHREPAVYCDGRQRQRSGRHVWSSGRPKRRSFVASAASTAAVTRIRTKSANRRR